jgi:hypothetical protein
VEPLGVATRHPKQPCDRIFGDVDQTGGSPYPTSFAQMVDDGGCMLLRDLRVEQGSAASLRKLLATRSAA